MLAVLLLGSLVGATLGILGGGGSTLAIPLLTYGVGLEPREAIATSLVVVGLAALAAAVPHWRGGTIDVRVAVTFGLVGSIASAAGAQLARFLPPGVQMTLFAMTMIVAAGFMLRRRAGSGSHDDPGTPKRKLPIVLAALGVGLLTGVVGIGGGFVVVPVLVVVAGMQVHRAIGTSLLVITFNALGGLLSYASYVTLAGDVVVPFTGAAVLAAVAGSVLGRQVQGRRLQSAFAVGLILLGVFTIAKEGLMIWTLQQ